MKTLVIRSAEPDYGLTRPLEKGINKRKRTKLWVDPFDILVSLTFKSDAQIKTPGRPLNASERKAVDNVLDCLKSYRDPVIKQIAGELSRREYRLDPSPAASGGKEDAAYVEAREYTNTIFLHPACFEVGAIFYNRDHTGSCWDFLAGVMIHENLHLDYGVGASWMWVFFDDGVDTMANADEFHTKGNYVNGLFEIMEEEQRSYQNGD